MTDSPDWLPALLLLEDEGGDWDRYFSKVKERFRVDFRDPRPPFRDKRMGLKRMPEVDGMSATFWHFVSENAGVGDSETDRHVDLRRCERIGWPMALIRAVDTDRVVTWEEDSGRGRKVLIALPDFSYLVVVDDRGDYVLPWTAYPVDRAHTREKLRKGAARAGALGADGAKKAEAAPKDGSVTPSTRGG